MLTVVFTGMPPSPRGRLGEGPRDGLSHRLRTGRVVVGQGRRELLAADASEEGALAEDALRDARERLQYLVSDGVTVAVVDRLEVIRIEEQQREGPPWIGSLDHPRAFLEEPPAGADRENFPLTRTS